MNNTNHLEKTSKKCKNFSSFLHFALKKIISLQVNYKIAFRYVFASETSAISKATRINNAIRRDADLFLVGMVAEDLRSRYKFVVLENKVNNIKFR